MVVKNMTVEEVLNYNQIIKAIVDNKDLKISPLLKFKFLGVLKKFEPIVANFEIIRNEKINEFGTQKLDADGNATGEVMIEKDDEEAMGKFTQAISGVVNATTDIEIEKFKLEEIMSEGLSSDYLLPLYNLIEGGE